MMESEDDLDRFLEGFENGTWPKEKWTHQAHVVMGGCYVLAHGVETATRLARERIPRYNVAQGGENTDANGYHETLTVFWIRVIAAFLSALPVAHSRLEKIRALSEHFGTRRDLFKSYYSYDVVQSKAARREWVPPDLRELG